MGYAFGPKKMSLTKSSQKNYHEDMNFSLRTSGEVRNHARVWGDGTRQGKYTHCNGESNSGPLDYESSALTTEVTESEIFCQASSSNLKALVAHVVVLVLTLSYHRRFLVCN